MTMQDSDMRPWKEQVASLQAVRERVRQVRADIGVDIQRLVAEGSGLALTSVLLTQFDAVEAQLLVLQRLMGDGPEGLRRP